MESKSILLEKYSEQSKEFIRINNPAYIFPSFEVIPLAEKITSVKNISAIVMDMDGTTTTTEELCIHSLETMVRRMTGKLTKSEWEGLTKVDYPNIIGNSTTKHVEYLINKYVLDINIENIFNSFVESAQWTITSGKDENRIKEVLINLKNFGINGGNDLSLRTREDIVRLLINNHPVINHNDLVKIGIDIYYHRYHEILQRISKGESRQVSQEIFGNSDKHLIEAMPGVAYFLCLVKGLLPGNAADMFMEYFPQYNMQINSESYSALTKLGLYFASKPAKVAVVTSSIYYEANIVLSEVFKILNQHPLISSLASSQSNIFSNYKNYYDAVITASDSSEIRLKPHRDLYSMALHQLNIPKSKFNEVIGFEDSESGTISIRAAGIGLCVAVPFAHTAGHQLDAATYICNDGLAEVLNKHKLFLELN